MQFELSTIPAAKAASMVTEVTKQQHVAQSGSPHNDKAFSFSYLPSTPIPCHGFSNAEHVIALFTTLNVCTDVRY